MRNKKCDSIYETLEIESQSLTRGETQNIKKWFKGFYESTLRHIIDEYGSFDLLDVHLEFKKIK